MTLQGSATLSCIFLISSDTQPYPNRIPGKAKTVAALIMHSMKDFL